MPSEIYIRDYSSELDAALSVPLSPENITTYAEDALSNVASLVMRYVIDYSDHPTIGFATQAETEDAAASYFKLRNVDEVLGHLSDRAEEIDSLRSRIVEAMVRDEVVVPPDSKESLFVVSGIGTMETKKSFNRLLTTLFILKNNFGVDVDDEKQLTMAPGLLTDDMWRNESYYVVETPRLQRTILICDEEGNVSYVYDSSKLLEQGITTDQIVNSSKKELDAILETHDRIGQRVIYSKNFTANIKSAISQPGGQLSASSEAEGTSYLYPKANDDVISLNAVRKKLGIDRATLVKILEELEIPQGKWQFKTLIGTGIHVDQLDNVTAHEFFKIPFAEGIAISAHQLAQELGTDHKVVVSRAQKLGVDFGEWRFGKTKQIGRGLSLEDAEALRQDKYFQTARLGESEVTVSGVSALLSSNISTVRKVLEELGIGTFDRRALGQIATSITKEDFEKLRSHPFYKTSSTYRRLTTHKK